MIRAVCLSLAILAAGLSAATAETKAKDLFGSKKSGSRQAPEAIGTYAKGCGAGLVQLPETGPTWQAMRLSRNRNWGHPETVSFIKRLSAKATQQGWKGLYIGDISQPRGGPMITGHQSHQIGLDMDIWMNKPKSLRLSRGQRENLSAISVRAKSQKTVNDYWTPAHAAIIEAAARDPAVDRIFVTPPVKAYFCQKSKRRDWDWIRKIRPLYGHHYHFHVRLKCPKGSRNCQTQRPTVKELSKGRDGCDETLNWWLTDYLNPPKVAPKKKKAKPTPRKRGARDYTMADLPRQCAGVLKSR
ncbi:penicillin-insensitive murein endopeptidase [Vannielia sp.]|uniref:penicillin-insensitive murein endopeptidase n=1 Tax=Vannielia sp. TaxID=2813045 RepID=UPI0026046810|nr:penicillin-insensitive murein endopeptidase [Vannielia sp.]MDF1872739.1 penicillin-insensitive murein endopeptidase [Vannielia sp.]